MPAKDYICMVFTREDGTEFGVTLLTGRQHFDIEPYDGVIPWGGSITLEAASHE